MIMNLNITKEQHVKRLISTGLIFSLLLLCPHSLFAESFYDIHEKLKDYDPTKVELAFPTFFIGLEYQHQMQSEPTQYVHNGAVFNSDLSSFSNPALTFGIYSFLNNFTGSIIFRSAPTQDKISDLIFYYANALEVSFKYYVWSLGTYQLRPYFGVSAVVSEYQQHVKEDSSAKVTQFSLPLSMGISYATNWGHFDIGASVGGAKKTSYPNPNNTGLLTTGTPETRVAFSYSHYLANKKLEDRDLAFSSVKSDFFFGLGYSSVTRVSVDDSLIKNQHTFAPLGSLGYYFSKWKSSLCISYRPIEHIYKNGNKETVYSRDVIGIEFLKYMGDFNNVVQFIGVGYNLETLQKTEKTNSLTTLDRTASLRRMGFIFGWETNVYNHPRINLRSTFRLNPLTFIEEENKKSISFEQFEFTFFELVFYPRRILSRN